MDHGEAVKTMAAERYLLQELTPEERDAFEAHYFECQECAMDLRAGAAFVDEASLQLPELAAKSPASAPVEARTRTAKTNGWFFSWRPAFAGLVFASLLVVIGYQNLVMYPALRESATQPRIIPLAPLHGETRGAGHLVITTDRKHGIALPIDTFGSLDSVSYPSYVLELQGPDEKLLWSETVAAPGNDETLNRSYLVVIPGAALHNGLHTLVVSGIASNGERTVLNRYVIEIRMTD